MQRHARKTILCPRAACAPTFNLQPWCWSGGGVSPHRLLVTEPFWLKPFWLKLNFSQTARCRRVLVGHLSDCQSVAFPFCFSLSIGFLQVMSQPRRSARLAARFQQSASSLPVLTDPDGFSDDMSEDLASFSDNVPLPPAPSCLRLFWASLSLRLAVLLSPHPLTVRH